MIIKDDEAPFKNLPKPIPKFYSASKYAIILQILYDRPLFLAFADALDSIPITLAENARMDVIDTLAGLHSKQLLENNPWIGIDVKGLEVADTRKKNIIKPLAVKEQVPKSAIETTAMLLRIDDVLSATKIWL